MKNESIINDDQYQFCISEANKLASILMTEDISEVFKNHGNAIFCLQTAIFLSAGIISLACKDSDMDENKVVDIFAKEIKLVMKRQKKLNLYCIKC